MEGLGKIGKEQTFAENVKTNGLGTLANEVNGKQYNISDVAGLQAMVVKDKLNKYNAVRSHNLTAQKTYKTLLKNSRPR